MKKRVLCQWLWELYTENCCWCSMDYHTDCVCNASDFAAEKLRELLGPKWHEKMRKRERAAA